MSRETRGPVGGRSAEGCLEVVEALPWYVNATLGPDERDRVTAHLEGCGRCRRELVGCREMAAAVSAGEVLAPVPHPARRARLLERLDPDLGAARVRRDASAPRDGRRRRLFGYLRTWRAQWTEAGPAVRWLSAAQLALATVLAIALVAMVLGRAGETGPAFRTLSDPAAAPAGPVAERSLIRVVFVPELEESRLRALLLELRAELVGGPSPLGAYTVAVPTGGPGSDPLQVVLGHLRGHEAVRFAEPVAAP